MRDVGQLHEEIAEAILDPAAKHPEGPLVLADWVKSLFPATKQPIKPKPKKVDRPDPSGTP